MNKKLKIIIEIIIVISLFIWYSFTIMVPELKQKFGSSDTFVNTKSYKNMIELKIDNTNFILAINKDDKVYHIFFLDKSSLVLYNQNIEKNNIDNSISKVVELLITNDILKQDSIIYVTRYGDESYNTFINSLKSNLDKYHINNNIIEKESTLKDKSLELGISPSLKDLDYYSKSISGIAKENKNETIKKDHKELSNNVYKKIEDYIFTNNINELDINNTELVITLIPADKSLKYYPTNNSWYYVKEKRIYAYIELDIDNNIKGYCYQGSIDKISEGECVPHE